MQIVVLTSAVEKVEGGGAVSRLGQSARVERHHLMRVGRWRIRLGAEDRNATKGSGEQAI
jgi:hypothetical protein